MTKLVIHTDGASQGNPGDAGIGVVISSESGDVIREVADYIGKTTNNVAEYSALIRGIQEAYELGAASIEIRTDSELLAFQITGVYKVKSEKLKPLHAEALALLRRFRNVHVSRVGREFNSRADELAGEGIKQHRRKQNKLAKPESGKQTAGKPAQGKLEL